MDNFAREIDRGLRRRGADLLRKSGAVFLTLSLLLPVPAAHCAEFEISADSFTVVNQVNISSATYFQARAIAPPNPALATQLLTPGGLYFDATYYNVWDRTALAWVKLATGTVESGRVAKSGDFMSGQLTTVSTITVQGNAFSVGGSTFVVTNGNVGIGTTSPSDRLQILKDVSPNNTVTGGLIFTRTALGANGANGIGNQILFQAENDAGSVANSAALGAQLSYAVAGSEQGTLLFNTANAGVFGEKMRIDYLGNVGIGTTAPATKLDVDGNAQFGSGAAKSTFSATGALTFANNAALNLSGATGNITTASSITASAFFGNGSALTGVSSADGTKVAKAGDTMTGQLTLAGSSLTVIGAAGIGAAGLSAGTLVVRSTSTTALNPVLNVQSNAGGELLRVQQDGNVGIGTTSPATKLHLSSGTLTIDGNATAGLQVFGSTFVILSNGNVGIGIAATNAGLELKRPAGSYPLFRLGDGNVVLPDYSGSGSVGTVSGTNAVGQFLSNRGGVGTDTRGGLLLQGFTASGVNDWHPLHLVGTHGGTSPTTAAVTISGQRHSGGNNRSPLAGAEPVFDVETNYLGTKLFRIQGGGSVGIGTTSPAATLHVSSAATAATTPILIVSSGTAAGQELLRVQKDGNVGIGTTAPATIVHGRQDVNGGTGFIMQNNTNGTSARTLYWTASATSEGGIIAVPSAHTLFGAHFADRIGVIAADATVGPFGLAASGLDLGAADATGDVRVYTGGMATTNERLRVTPAGSVGIGTPSPGAKLDITQSAAGQMGARILMPMGAENTQAGLRIQGYSPAIELMDKDNVQNWYMGIDDNDANKLLIGRGYGPGQGVLQAVTIDASDNVGIGTTGPEKTLDIYKSGQSANAVLIRSDQRSDFPTTGGALGTINFSTDGNIANPPVVGRLQSFIENGVYSARLGVYNGAGGVVDGLVVRGNSGNVGVGTASPNSPLEVRGDSRISTAAGSYCILRVSDTTTCAAGALIGTNGNRALCLICN